jgi:hypothetical protein
MWGRYRLRPGIVALLMADRGIDGLASGQAEFFGHFGLQIALSD